MSESCSVAGRHRIISLAENKESVFAQEQTTLQDSIKLSEAMHTKANTYIY